VTDQADPGPRTNDLAETAALYAVMNMNPSEARRIVRRMTRPEAVRLWAQLDYLRMIIMTEHR
jgi:hypothetical protein